MPFSSQLSVSQTCWRKPSSPLRNEIPAKSGAAESQKEPRLQGPCGTTMLDLGYLQERIKLYVFKSILIRVFIYLQANVILRDKAGGLHKEFSDRKVLIPQVTCLTDSDEDSQVR